MGATRQVHGLRDVLLRTGREVSADSIGIVAAGVAFYAFLAVFPAIVTAVAIYGLVVEPATVQEQLEALSAVLPAEAQQLLNRQLSTITAQPPAALGWGVVASAVVGLWSANKGMKALFEGLNVAYDQEDRRGFFAKNIVTLPFTFGAILVVLVMGALIVAYPVALRRLALPGTIEFALDWARWVLLVALILFSLTLLYRYAPHRKPARGQWLSWGAIVAALLWIAGSWGFSFYVSNFGSYNETYGSVGAAVILMMWFLLSAYAILLGAELNSEIEEYAARKRRADTSGHGVPDVSPAITPGATRPAPPSTSPRRRRSAASPTSHRDRS